MQYNLKHMSTYSQGLYCALNALMLTLSFHLFIYSNRSMISAIVIIIPQCIVLFVTKLCVRNVFLHMCVVLAVGCQFLGQPVLDSGCLFIWQPTNHCSLLLLVLVPCSCCVSVVVGGGGGVSCVFYECFLLVASVCLVRCPVCRPSFCFLMTQV